MKIFLLAAVLLAGCQKPKTLVLVNDGPWTNNTAALIATNERAMDGLAKQVHGIIGDFKKMQELAQYWHDAYFRHMELSHGGPGMFNINQDFIGGIWDQEPCSYIGAMFSTDQQDFPPLVSITMPCGYVWELRWGDRVPETDVPCPCGKPEHWVFQFDRHETFGTWTNIPSNMP